MEERESLSSMDLPEFKATPTHSRVDLCISESRAIASSHESESGFRVDAQVEADGGDVRSILAGGNLCGWTPDVAVVVWRRLLGSLGDVNAISDAHVHTLVFEHLCDLADSVIKVRFLLLSPAFKTQSEFKFSVVWLCLQMRENLSVSVDNLTSPALPNLIPPIWLLIPWALEVS